MSNPPDPLDRLLDSWTESTESTSQLTSEVWRRIALAQSSRREMGGLWQYIDAWLSRPPFAALFVACCALLGLFLAEVRVNRQQREQSAQLARSYLQLIDPLLRADSAAQIR